MRLFVSVDLPPELTVAVQEVQDLFEDASGLRLTDPSQAHLTLKFLGDVDESRLDAVVDALDVAVDATEIPPFEAEFGGLGVFPHLDYISVIWLGVTDGDHQFSRLHEEIEDRMTALGFEAEDHDLTPHVTLARMEHAGGKELVQQVVEQRDPTVGAMTVESVSLTESTLTDDGPEYETVAAFELDG